MFVLCGIVLHFFNPVHLSGIMLSGIKFWLIYESERNRMPLHHVKLLFGYFAVERNTLQELCD